MLTVVDVGKFAIFTVIVIWQWSAGTPDVAAQVQKAVLDQMTVEANPDFTSVPTENSNDTEILTEENNIETPAGDVDVGEVSITPAPELHPSSSTIVENTPASTQSSQEFGPSNQTTPAITETTTNSTPATNATAYPPESDSASILSSDTDNLSPPSAASLPDVTPEPDTLGSTHGEDTANNEVPESTESGSVVEVEASDEYISGEILVQVAPTSSLVELYAYVDQVGAEIVSEIPELGVVEVVFPDGDIEGHVLAMRSLDSVQYAEPNYFTTFVETYPNDPGWSNQYSLLNIQAPLGWDMTTGSPNVTIAILDTGVDLTHPDLSSKLVPGYDILNNDNDPSDDHGHGTHVAGIAAAVTDNHTGVAGASWGAQIMPVKVLNSSGSGTYANLAAGIVWAADHGAQIINLSLGGSFRSPILEDAVNYAYSQGVVQVAAAGNSGIGSVLYPGSYAHVVAVGATDANNDRAGFSNYGPELELVAPGVSIYSTSIGSVYGNRSGTSMAAPLVSGLAAILAGMSRPYTPELIFYEMASTALDLGSPGRDIYYGYGLIQMDAAIRSALPTSTPTSLPQIQQPSEDDSRQGENEKRASPTNTPPLRPSATFTATPTATASPTLSPTATSTATSTSTISAPDEITALEQPANISTATSTNSSVPFDSLSVKNSSPPNHQDQFNLTDAIILLTGTGLTLYTARLFIRKRQ